MSALIDLCIAVVLVLATFVFIRVLMIVSVS